MYPAGELAVLRQLLFIFLLLVFVVVVFFDAVVFFWNIYIYRSVK